MEKGRLLTNAECARHIEKLGSLFPWFLAAPAYQREYKYLSMRYDFLPFPAGAAFLMKDHSLLETGLEFVKFGLSALVQEQRQREDLIYSLLYFWTGTELLLKAPLAEEHWSLVFEDTDKANRAAYNSGDFISVNFDNAVSRLAGVRNIKVTPEQKTALRSVRDMRNKLMHFGILQTDSAVSSIIAQALHFLCNDYRRQAFPNDDFSEIIRLAHQLDEFIEHGMSLIKERLCKIRESGELILRCPHCHQLAGILTPPGKWSCLFCSSTELDSLGIWEVNGLHPPAWTSADMHQGCCNDLVLEIEEYDGDGVPTSQIFICCACARKEEQLVEFYDRDDRCGACGGVPDHEHD